MLDASKAFVEAFQGTRSWAGKVEELGRELDGANRQLSNYKAKLALAKTNLDKVMKENG